MVMQVFDKIGWDAASYLFINHNPNLLWLGLELCDRVKGRRVEPNRNFSYGYAVI